MVSERDLRKFSRRAGGVLIAGLAVWYVPRLVLFFLVCGFIDLMRHREITPFLLKRYFMGNGILTMLLSPVNLLADLFSYKNKIIYKIDDLPEDYQKEINEVIDIFKEKKDDIMQVMDKQLADSGRGMLFIKWYDKVIEQSIVDFDYDCKYIKTVAVSAFNRGNKTKLHFGPLRLSLRVLYNLNPVKDDQIYIHADSVKHYWHDDPLFIFDDTVMHESLNNSDSQIRYCLFMDIVRPSDHYEAFNFVISKTSVLLNGIKEVFYKNWKTIS